MINGNIDILMISETKIDETYSAAQFFFERFCNPYPYENFILLGNFNSEMTDSNLKDFCNL